jgi:uncharacterized membrane protein HdeD (DUF308 family)
MMRTARVVLGSVLIVLDLILLLSNWRDPLLVTLALIMLIPLGILVFRKPKSGGAPSRVKWDRGTKSLVFATIAVLLTPTFLLTFIGIGFAVGAAVYGVLAIRSREDRRGLWKSIAGLSIGVVGTALELWGFRLIARG